MVTCSGSCCYSSSSAFLLTTWINVHPKSPKAWYPHCVCEVWVQPCLHETHQTTLMMSLYQFTELIHIIIQEAHIPHDESRRDICISFSQLVAELQLWKPTRLLCSSSGLRTLLQAAEWRRFSVVSCLMTRRKKKTRVDKNGFTSGWKHNE